MSRKPSVTKTAARPTSVGSDLLDTLQSPSGAIAVEAPNAEPATPEVSPLEIAAMASRMRAGASGDALLFSYVFNHGAPKDKRLPSFRKIFSNAVDLGHEVWPNEIKSLIWGKDVLDFGCGSTLYGPVIRALGARSYTGIDKAIDPSRKRFRSRTLKQTVTLDFSMADLAHVIPNITYLQADDVVSRDAFDIVLMQSVTHQLMEPEKVLKNIHRSLRPGGEIWILHDNFYSWAGHQQSPKSVASYNPDEPSHQAFVDWGHIGYEPVGDHPFRTVNRMRLGQLRSLLDRYFAVDGWKEIPDRSSVVARLTPEIRQKVSGFEDRELLTRQVIIRGVKR